MNDLSNPAKEKSTRKEYQFLEIYTEWFKSAVNQIDTHQKDLIFEIPELPVTDSPIHRFFQYKNLETEHRITIILLLLDHYCPELFLPFLGLFTKEETRGLIGGKLCEHTKLYEPALQTVAFLVSGNKLERKIKSLHILEEAGNSLMTDGVIDYKYKEYRGIKAPITLTDDYRHAIMGNSEIRLDSGDNFPARFSPSKLNFNEVILGEKTMQDLNPLFDYLQVRKEISDNKDLQKRIKSSFITVFSGYPGTGKTVAARAIGKMFGMDTYTLELSRVVSKYIGEFEKSVDKVLTRLSGKNCILFIDEADSVFTKRIENIADAKDKYVNQEMAYLLQRLEEYEGVIILASNVANFKQHIDNAMLRRIRNIVQFHFPNYGERLKLWENALPDSFNLEEGLLVRLAQNFQLSGASIYSIVSELIIYILKNNAELITLDLIKPFIEADFKKRDIQMRPCKDEENPQLVMAQRVGKQVMSTGKRM